MSGGTHRQVFFAELEVKPHLAEIGMEIATGEMLQHGSSS
jgi:hypothetical protein